MGSPLVLDSFACLAYLLGEPSGALVRGILGAGLRGETELHVCAVNVTEVTYRLRRLVGGAGATEGIRRFLALGLTVHDADLDLCLAAAALKRPRVALGDAFAAALAQRLDAAVVTGDPEFRHLEDVVRVEWL